jgi:NAD(P)-dependent dehydrogenase (short-subunit alcohol dehydrogenase family)
MTENGLMLSTLEFWHNVMAINLWGQIYSAREVTRFGVRVNCVCPGPTDTPLFHAATVQQQGIV